MKGATATVSSEDEPRSVPIVDLDRIAETYGELKKMEVPLDPNPIEYGPKRFNNKIARVRTMLSRVEQLFLQTSEDLHFFQRLINAKQTLYELEKRELMVNDPRCRVGRAQQERADLADVQLRAQIEAIQHLELAAHDLETVMVSIKSKRTDLKNIQSRMKDQMKLLEHDLGMGARWGSNAPPSAVGASVNEIDDMLAAMDKGLGIVETEDEEETEDTTEDTTEEDPSPQAPELEPVLVFGEEEATEEAEAVDAPLPDDDSEGEMPANEQAQDEADDFLDALNAGTSEDEEMTPSDGASDDESGIDDLIASLADD